MFILEEVSKRLLEGAKKKTNLIEQKSTFKQLNSKRCPKELLLLVKGPRLNKLVRKLYVTIT